MDKKVNNHENAEIFCSTETPKPRVISPPSHDVSPIYPKRLQISYVGLRDTFREILEEYFGENIFVLGQSSANL